MNKWQKCPLYNWCPNRSGACLAELPDEGCPWYRWFKELIEENNKDNINE